MNNDIISIKAHIRDVLKLLDRAESDLKNARGLGFWDILGGKSLVGLAKHRKISQSEKNLKKVERELKLLQKELNSLNIPINSKINAGSFNQFMDIFVDNPISNWYTQSKIKDGLKEINTIKRLIENIYSDLENI